MARHPLDLTGKRFGDLEVLEATGRTPKGASLWRCLCHRCGAETVIEGQRLTAKKSPKVDCGCAYRDKRADLTGKTIGVLDVLKYTRTSQNGDRLYLCRCHLCGAEKELPASTIRAKLTSCGCRQYSSERMESMSRMGVAVAIVDGANIPALARKEANATSHTCVRGVTRLNNGTYLARCQVRGERWWQGGFCSIETAKAARDKKQKELMDKYNIELDPQPPD